MSCFTRRSTQLRLLLSVILLGAGANSAQALLIGAPTWNTPPSSAMGSITLNTLAATSLGNGFSVSGQIDVNITTATAAGILLEYEIDWPIDPAYPFNPSLFTTTIIDGYSLPPIGTVGNTFGFVDSYIVTLPNTMLVPSAAALPLSLVAGIDSPAWSPPIGINSGTFAFGGAPGMALRQHFFLDGNYMSGPGGIWTIDLPVITMVSQMPAVPEPNAIYLAICSLMGICGVCWRRSRHK